MQSDVGVEFVRQYNSTILNTDLGIYASMSEYLYSACGYAWIKQICGAFFPNRCDGVLNYFSSFYVILFHWPCELIIDTLLAKTIV